MSGKTWRRIRVLELLNEGISVRGTAKAVGCYPREVSRVGKRYVRGGLELALTDDPRPKPSKMLDSPQEAAIVAMICRKVAHDGPCGSPPSRQSSGRS
jgi:hypothetical protein